MIQLKLIMQRPAIIPTLAGWFEGIGPYLQQTVGIGFNTHLAFFQKGQVQSFRDPKEMQKVKRFILSHQTTVMKELSAASVLYDRFTKHWRHLTKTNKQSLVSLLQNFYNDYLASWRVNFFALWVPQLTTKKELGENGQQLYQLALAARSQLDPLVFAQRFYQKLFGCFKNDATLLTLSTNEEIISFLYGTLSQKQKRNILRREEGWLLFRNRAKLATTLDEVRLFLKQYGFTIKTESRPATMAIIKGQVACRGTAGGSVRLLFREQDNYKVRKGDILVSPMTTPVFMPAIKKCTGIITDEGGITCHAAIVSRELGIPCVIGTKIATQVLKDGDRVEVDANKGIVKKI